MSSVPLLFYFPYHLAFIVIDSGCDILYTRTIRTCLSLLPPSLALTYDSFQVKILVPNCTAGLVIGKVGAYVKEIKDRTGAFIQISQKSKEINLLERCITIAGACSWSV